MTVVQKNKLFSLIQFFGLSSAFLAIVFVINNFFIFNFGAAGFLHTVNLGSFSGVQVPKTGFNDQAVIFGGIQTLVIFGTIGYSAFRA
ncbi:MAG: hypothetical protein VW124_20490, partial [Paracoccaceae bacterium]